MPGSDSHLVMIERRGVAHQARCRCGWSGHSWNELRPAEADAWHHTYGDDRVVEVKAAQEGEWGRYAGPGSAVPEPVNRIVDAARSLARSNAPHRPAVIEDLTRAAAGSTAALDEANEEIGDLLRRHARRNAGAADEEWLELHTARRLIEAARQRLDV
ncbi:MAG TPA: hypothetical protein VGR90_08650 [Acidimicrobiales bacterium]|nr:hypothetical protein [Acidimicrobiales bacterium]